MASPAEKTWYHTMPQHAILNKLRQYVSAFRMLCKYAPPQELLHLAFGILLPTKTPLNEFKPSEALVELQKYISNDNASGIKQLNGLTNKQKQLLCKDDSHTIIPLAIEAIIFLTFGYDLVQRNQYKTLTKIYCNNKIENNNIDITSTVINSIKYIFNIDLTIFSFANNICDYTQAHVRVENNDYYKNIKNAIKLAKNTKNDKIAKELPKLFAFNDDNLPSGVIKILQETALPSRFDHVIVALTTPNVKQLTTSNIELLPSDANQTDTADSTTNESDASEFHNKHNGYNSNELLDLEIHNSSQSESEISDDCSQLSADPESCTDAEQQVSGPHTAHSYTGTTGPSVQLRRYPEDISPVPQSAPDAWNTPPEEIEENTGTKSAPNSPTLSETVQIEAPLPINPSYKNPTPMNSIRSVTSTQTAKTLRSIHTIQKSASKHKHPSPTTITEEVLNAFNDINSQKAQKGSSMKPKNLFHEHESENKKSSHKEKSSDSKVQQITPEADISSPYPPALDEKELQLIEEQYQRVPVPRKKDNPHLLQTEELIASMQHVAHELLTSQRKYPDSKFDKRAPLLNRALIKLHARQTTCICIQIFLINNRSYHSKDRKEYKRICNKMLNTLDITTKFYEDRILRSMSKYISPTSKADKHVNWFNISVKLNTKKPTYSQVAQFRERQRSFLQGEITSQKPTKSPSIKQFTNILGSNEKISSPKHKPFTKKGKDKLYNMQETPTAKNNKAQSKKPSHKTHKKLNPEAPKVTKQQDKVDNPRNPKVTNSPKKSKAKWRKATPKKRTFDQCVNNEDTESTHSSTTYDHSYPSSPSKKILSEEEDDDPSDDSDDSDSNTTDSNDTHRSDSEQTGKKPPRKKPDNDDTDNDSSTEDSSEDTTDTEKTEEKDTEEVEEEPFSMTIKRVKSRYPGNTKYPPHRASHDVQEYIAYELAIHRVKSVRQHLHAKLECNTTSIRQASDEATKYLHDVWQWYIQKASQTQGVTEEYAVSWALEKITGPARERLQQEHFDKKPITTITALTNWVKRSYIAASELPRIKKDALKWRPTKVEIEQNIQTAFLTLIHKALVINALAKAQDTDDMTRRASIITERVLVDTILRTLLEYQILDDIDAKVDERYRTPQNMKQLNQTFKKYAERKQYLKNVKARLRSKEGTSYDPTRSNAAHSLTPLAHKYPPQRWRGRGRRGRTYSRYSNRNSRRSQNRSKFAFANSKYRNNNKPRYTSKYRGKSTYSTSKYSSSRGRAQRPSYRGKYRKNYYKKQYNNDDSNARRNSYKNKYTRRFNCRHCGKFHGKDVRQCTASQRTKDKWKNRQAKRFNTIQSKPKRRGRHTQKMHRPANKHRPNKPNKRQPHRSRRNTYPNRATTPGKQVKISDKVQIVTVDNSPEPTLAHQQLFMIRFTPPQEISKKSQDPQTEEEKTDSEESESAFMPTKKHNTYHIYTPMQIIRQHNRKIDTGTTPEQRRVLYLRNHDSSSYQNRTTSQDRQNHQDTYLQPNDSDSEATNEAIQNTMCAAQMDTNNKAWKQIIIKYISDNATITTPQTSNPKGNPAKIILPKAGHFKTTEVYRQWAHFITNQFTFHYKHQYDTLTQWWHRTIYQKYPHTMQRIIQKITDNNSILLRKRLKIYQLLKKMKAADAEKAQSLPWRYISEGIAKQEIKRKAPLIQQLYRELGGHKLYLQFLQAFAKVTDNKTHPCENETYRIHFAKLDANAECIPFIHVEAKQKLQQASILAMIDEIPTSDQNIWETQRRAWHQANHIPCRVDGKGQCHGHSDNDEKSIEHCPFNQVKMVTPIIAKTRLWYPLNWKITVDFEYNPLEGHIIIQFLPRTPFDADLEAGKEITENISDIIDLVIDHLNTFSHMILEDQALTVTTQIPFQIINFKTENKQIEIIQRLPAANKQASHIKLYTLAYDHKHQVFYKLISIVDNQKAENLVVASLIANNPLHVTPHYRLQQLHQWIYQFPTIATITIANVIHRQTMDGQYQNQWIPKLEPEMNSISMIDYAESDTEITNANIPVSPQPFDQEKQDSINNFHMDNTQLLQRTHISPPEITRHAFAPPNSAESFPMEEELSYPDNWTTPPAFHFAPRQPRTFTETPASVAIKDKVVIKVCQNDPTNQDIPAYEITRLLEAEGWRTEIVDQINQQKLAESFKKIRETAEMNKIHNTIEEMENREQLNKVQEKEVQLQFQLHELQTQNANYQSQLNQHEQERKRLQERLETAWQEQQELLTFKNLLEEQLDIQLHSQSVAEFKQSLHTPSAQAKFDQVQDSIELARKQHKSKAALKRLKTITQKQRQRIEELSQENKKLKQDIGTVQPKLTTPEIESPEPTNPEKQKSEASPKPVKHEEPTGETIPKIETTTENHGHDRKRRKLNSKKKQGTKERIPKYLPGEQKVAKKSQHHKCENNQTGQTPKVRIKSQVRQQSPPSSHNQTPPPNTYNNCRILPLTKEQPNKQKEQSLTPCHLEIPATPQTPEPDFVFSADEKDDEKAEQESKTKGNTAPQNKTKTKTSDSGENDNAQPEEEEDIDLTTVPRSTSEEINFAQLPPTWNPRCKPTWDQMEALLKIVDRLQAKGILPIDPNVRNSTATIADDMHKSFPNNEAVKASYIIYNGVSDLIRDQGWPPLTADQTRVLLDVAVVTGRMSFTRDIEPRTPSLEQKMNFHPITNLTMASRYTDELLANKIKYAYGIHEYIGHQITYPKMYPRYYGQQTPITKFMQCPYQGERTYRPRIPQKRLGIMKRAHNRMDAQEQAKQTPIEKTTDSISDLFTRLQPRNHQEQQSQNRSQHHKRPHTPIPPTPQQRQFQRSWNNKRKQQRKNRNSTIPGDQHKQRPRKNKWKSHQNHHINKVKSEQGTPRKTSNTFTSTKGPRKGTKRPFIEQVRKTYTYHGPHSGLNPTKIVIEQPIRSQETTKLGIPFDICPLCDQQYKVSPICETCINEYKIAPDWQQPPRHNKRTSANRAKHRVRTNTTRIKHHERRKQNRYNRRRSKRPYAYSHNRGKKWQKYHKHHKHNKRNKNPTKSHPKRDREFTPPLRIHPMVNRSSSCLKYNTRTPTGNGEKVETAIHDRLHLTRMLTACTNWLIRNSTIKHKIAFDITTITTICMLCILLFIAKPQVSNGLVTQSPYPTHEITKCSNTVSNMDQYNQINITGQVNYTELYENCSRFLSNETKIELYHSFKNAIKEEWSEYQDRQQRIWYNIFRFANNIIYLILYIFMSLVTMLLIIIRVFRNSSHLKKLTTYLAHNIIYKKFHKCIPHTISRTMTYISFGILLTIYMTTFAVSVTTEQISTYCQNLIHDLQDYTDTVKTIYVHNGRFKTRKTQDPRHNSRKKKKEVTKTKSPRRALLPNTDIR